MMANDHAKSEVQKLFPLSAFKESYEESVGNATGGKFLFDFKAEDLALVDGAEFEEFSI